jgi:hypothetical protein
MVFGGTLKNPVYQELRIEKSEIPPDSPKVPLWETTAPRIPSFPNACFSFFSLREL